MDELTFKNNYFDFNEPINLTYPYGYNYLKARKHIGICNNINIGKILIYGSRSIDLINYISIKKFDPDKQKAINTVFIKNNRIIEEVNIYKLSALRYLVTTENPKKLLRFLTKVKRKFPLITLSDVTNKYSIFSFFGNDSNNFFDNIKSNNLYKLLHQNYLYYNLIVNKKSEIQTINYFKNLQFIPISLETRNIFLYNNSVVTHLNKIKKKWKKRVISSIYNYNFPKKRDKKKIFIKQFELQENAITYKGQYIYNSKGKISGVIHSSYKLPNKRNPYILCFVWNNNIEKTAILKEGKREILLKQFKLY